RGASARLLACGGRDAIHAVMTTAQRAAGIAAAAGGFAAWLGRVEASELLELVRLELGDARILDEFCVRGSVQCRAGAPRVILHGLSGNTPHAALQTIMRGLLLGSHNRCKLPAGGLPEATAFRSALPAHLASLVEFSESLADDWFAGADAIIVFGTDETI